MSYISCHILKKQKKIQTCIIRKAFNFVDVIILLYVTSEANCRGD